MHSLNLKTYNFDIKNLFYRKYPLEEGNFKISIFQFHIIFVDSWVTSVISSNYIFSYLKSKNIYNWKKNKND